MIKITNLRDSNGSGQWINMGVYDKSIEKALEMFALYELGYGGQITDYVDNGETLRLTVDTTVLGTCKDRTHFEGLKEEMKSLVEFGDLYLQAQAACMSEGPAREVLLNKAFQMSGGGNPRILSLGLDMFLGQGRLGMAVLCGLGGTKEQVQKLLKHSGQDLFILYQFVKLEGMKLDEAIELIS